VIFLIKLPESIYLNIAKTYKYVSRILSGGVTPRLVQG